MDNRFSNRKRFTSTTSKLMSKTLYYFRGYIYIWCNTQLWRNFLGGKETCRDPVILPTKSVVLIVLSCKHTEVPSRTQTILYRENTKKEKAEAIKLNLVYVLCLYSDGNTVEDIIFKWMPGKTNIAVVHEELAQFKYMGSSLESGVTVLSTG